MLSDRNNYTLTLGLLFRSFRFGGPGAIYASGVLSILPAFDDPIAASAGILTAGASLTRAVVAEHVKERGRDRKR